MQVTEKKAVTIKYTLRDEEGAVLDSTEGRDPLTYLHGAGNLVPGVEEALEGKSAGEEVKVTVSPEKGYGVREEDNVRNVPIRKLPTGKLVPGATVQLNTNHGPVVAVIKAVKGDYATLDLNHPLAGKTLRFELEVVEVRDATEEELAHGHVHGPGGASDLIRPWRYSFLAAGAVVGAAGRVALGREADGRPADAAGMSRAPVDVKACLAAWGGAAAGHVAGGGALPGAQVLAHQLLRARVETRQRRVVDGRDRRERVGPLQKEDFALVDVADAGGDALVQQQRPQRRVGRPVARACDGVGWIEGGRQDIRTQGAQDRVRMREGGAQDLDLRGAPPDRVRGVGTHDQAGARGQRRRQRPGGPTRSRPASPGGHARGPDQCRSAGAFRALPPGRSSGRRDAGRRRPAPTAP